MKMLKPLVSIVVLNYNGVNYLKKTIPKLLSLDYPNYEIIVVDNYSTDRSKKFLKKFKKIMLIENRENLGYSKGKNLGARIAQGKYLFLLDNDILINDPYIIKNLLYFYEHNRDSIISIPLKDSDKQKVTYYGGYFGRLFEPRAKNNLNPILKGLSGYPNGGAIFTSSKIWTELGGFDESQPFNLDDRDLGIRAYLFGYRVVLFNNYLEHLGYQHKFNLKYWSWKYRYYYSGNMRIILKNLIWYNSIRYSILFTLYTILKTFKQTLGRRSLLPLISFIHSFYLFIRYLPDTIRQRNIIQSKRVIKNDLFLKIKNGVEC